MDIKKLLFFLSLLSCLSVSCTSDEAENNTKTTNFKYIITGGGIRIIRIADVNEVIIPSTIEVDGITYPVTSIGSGAASNLEFLKVLHLPPTLTEIASNAFEISYIEKVYIEDLSAWCNIDFQYDYWSGTSGTHYYSSASPFSVNTVLYINDEPVETLVIPEDVERVNQYAFQGLEFKCLKLGKNVKEIGMGAFQYSKIEDLDMGPNLEVIKNNAFSDCKRLKKIKLSPNLKTLEWDSFVDCPNVSEIHISSLENFCYLNYKEYYAWLPFGNPYSLYINGKEPSEIIIPYLKEELGNGCLSGASNISSIECEEGITSIGMFSFTYCQNLEKLVLPSTINQVPTDFVYCFNLKSIEVKSLTPPRMYGSYLPYDYLFDNCVLYVPEESIQKYKVTEGWKKFKTVLPL